MRTKWTVLLWMLMISGLLAAQNTANTSFQVKGILLDSLTQEGEPYATIKIVKKEAPAKALKMLVTDMKGQFQEKVPGTGNFVMTITSVGRTPIVKDFSVKAGEKLVDFGTLYIVDASNELGQVEKRVDTCGFPPLVYLPFPLEGLAQTRDRRPLRKRERQSGYRCVSFVKYSQFTDRLLLHRWFTLRRRGMTVPRNS